MQERNLSHASRRFGLSPVWRRRRQFLNDKWQECRDTTRHMSRDHAIKSASNNIMARKGTAHRWLWEMVGKAAARSGRRAGAVGVQGARGRVIRKEGLGAAPLCAALRDAIRRRARACAVPAPRCSGAGRIARSEARSRVSFPAHPPPRARRPRHSQTSPPPL